MEAVLTHLLAALAGAVAGWTISVKFNSRHSKTTQKGNVVGGDQAGGDIHKRQ